MFLEKDRCPHYRGILRKVVLLLEGVIVHNNMNVRIEFQEHGNAVTHLATEIGWGKYLVRSMRSGEMNVLEM